MDAQTTDTSTSSSTTQTPTPDAGTGNPPANWEAQAREWENRFKGLQKTLATKETTWTAAVESHESTIARMTSEAQEFGKIKDGLAAQLKAYEGQVAAISGERDQFKTDAATSGQKLTRLQTIAKFPTLLEAETQGLLRTDLAGDDFLKHLETFAAHFGQKVTQNTADFMKGAVPPMGSSRTGQSASRETLMAQMHEALSKGDTKAYDAVYTQLLGLDSK